jgi:hypothetical protein
MPSPLTFKKLPGRQKTTDEMTITARCIMARGGRASDVAKLLGVQNIQAQRIIAGTKGFNPGPSLDAQPLPVSACEQGASPSTHRRVVAAMRNADRSTMLSPGITRAIASERALVVNVETQTHDGFTDHVITVRVFRQPKWAPAAP